MGPFSTAHDVVLLSGFLSYAGEEWILLIAFVVYKLLRDLR